VLITGGSRGLGLALAKEFAQGGAKVAICGRSTESLTQATNLLQSHGYTVLAIPCDVSEETAAEQLVAEVGAQLGPIDVLVNNAGRIDVGPIESITREDFDKAMKTHFLGPLNITWAVLPEMKRRRAGRIINISSIGGKLGVPHLAPYVASKFALAGFSEALSAELRKDGIRVTTVYPGLMRTGSPRNANFKGRHKKEYTWFSLSSALPLLTIAAERAARQIVGACKSGKSSLIITPAAKAAAFLHEAFPNVTIDILALANRLLPAYGGLGTGVAKGRDSETFVTQSWATVLNDRAARRFNQFGESAVN